MKTLPLIRSVIMFIGLSLMANGQAPKSHDQAFWKTIIAHDFAVPSGASQVALAEELRSYLRSPDPEWRDDIAAIIFTAWIAQQQSLPPAEVNKLADEWMDQLHAESYSQSDATVARTFSALMLGIVVYGDNHKPMLEEAQYRRILRAGLEYLAREKDLRGYDARLGWIHATAHTADLLKFAARSRFFTRQDQATVLEAIRTRLQTASGVFVRGEDERLARAVLSILMRPDFDASAFREWLQRMKVDLGFPKAVTVDALDRRQNLVNLLSKLEVICAGQPADAAGPKLAKEDLIAVLKTIY